MFISFPILSIIILILFFYLKFPLLGWRVAYLLAVGMLFSLAVVFLEVMSLFSAITVFNVRLFWVIISGISIGIFFLAKRKHLFSKPTIAWAGILERTLLFLIIGILSVNLFISFIAAPNNWDSMAYHLPRVMHWVDYQSIYFYPTDILRQNFNHPGAEYFLLHIFYLTGNDSWFNALQWFSFAGCIIAVSLIARYFGASFLGQVLSGFFVVTMPMAVLQSTSTQNDLVAGFMISSFIALGLILQRNFSRFVFFLMVAFLGLSALVKGIFFILFPFVCSFFIVLWKKGSKYFTVAICIVIVLAGGYYFRCFTSLEGESVLNHEQSSLLMSRYDPPAVITNGLCQLASELMIPHCEAVRYIQNGVGQIALWMGIDLRQPELFQNIFSRIPSLKMVFDEDYASNPLHVVLIFLLPLFLFLIRCSRQTWIYYICVLTASLLFLFLIRWQPWITRLHLPLIILFAPLVGMALARWKWLAVFIGLLLFLMAGKTILLHQTRPLIGARSLIKMDRRAHYFVKKPQAAGSYAQVAAVILSSGCREVGLIMGNDSWEYPLWALTGYGKVKFRKFLSSQDWGCLVVTVDSPHKNVLIGGKSIYAKVEELSPLQVFYRIKR